MTDAKMRSFARSPELQSSRFYMGNLISFLVAGSETAGRLSITDAWGAIGNEPPPHVHELENETWYILSGSVEFFTEDQDKSLQVSEGGVVFVPRGTAHAVYFRSQEVRTLLIAQAVQDEPVQLDSFFRDVSVPAQSMSLPTASTAFSDTTPEQMHKAVEDAARRGTFFLTPEEVATRLPHYPGFMANLTA